jgi:DNA-binding transcriptional MerR regulator
VSIKTSFSIKDLENLSGIKAHTIRIWEKRYNLLEPIRTDTNIRNYDLDNLVKILNISLLNQSGVKISKIAVLSKDQLHQTVRELVLKKNSSDYAISAFKVSMLTFDQEHFDNTFNQLLTHHSFREVFLNVILRLLEDIGHLWTIKTIVPAHENFITTLIKQKLLINIERVKSQNLNHAKTMVLFLPMHEIHDLGLLYIHFELLLKGYKSIYLGPSVPLENLKELQKLFTEIEYISYFTVSPSTDDIEAYVSALYKQVLVNKDEHVHLLGRKTRFIDSHSLPKNVHLHESINSVLEKIESFSDFSAK